MRAVLTKARVFELEMFQVPGGGSYANFGNENFTVAATVRFKAAASAGACIGPSIAGRMETPRRRANLAEIPNAPSHVWTMAI